jgi:hypothetical protein
VSPREHRCGSACICPIHRTPLLYWPASRDQHACQNADCVHAHGIIKEDRMDNRYDGFEVPPRPTTDEEFAALPRLDMRAARDHMRSERVRNGEARDRMLATPDGLAKLNSATQYPSIDTYHLMDKGVLQDVPVYFDSDVIVTEKVNGANSRLIAMPDGDWYIGSRTELLCARGDRIGNPAEGIADALRPLADRLAEDNYTTRITVFYFETYGGKVGSAAKQYTSAAQVGLRLFDIAFIDPFVLDWERDKIAAWRDSGGQSFVDEDTLQRAAEVKGVKLAPRLLTLDGADLPEGIASTEEWLKLLLPHTLVHLDGAGGDSEGVVLRSADRKTIAKARFEDYARTMKRRAGRERDGYGVEKRR